MTYAECLRLTFLDLQSWLILLVGLACALVLKKLAMPRAAMLAAVVAMVFAVSWAYFFYQLSCVELYEG